MEAKNCAQRTRTPKNPRAQARSGPGAAGHGRHRRTKTEKKNRPHPSLHIAAKQAQPRIQFAGACLISLLYCLFPNFIHAYPPLAHKGKPATENQHLFSQLLAFFLNILRIDKDKGRGQHPNVPPSTVLPGPALPGEPKHYPHSHRQLVGYARSGTD